MIRNVIFFGFLLILEGGLLFSCSTTGKRQTKNPGHGNKYDVAAFDYIYVEAIKQKLMGNGGDALKYLEQCVRVNPESDASNYQMAQIVLANGDIRNGKKYALRAYSLDEMNLWYIMLLSSIYYQEGNIDSAIVYYEKAVSFYPGKQNLMVTLGNLYSEKKDFEKASYIFNSIEQRFGKSEETSLIVIRNLVEGKKYDEAVNKILLLIKDYPDTVRYYAIMAEIYSYKGEKEKAQEVYGKLMEENPDNPQIILSLCDFLLTEKRFDEYFMMLNSVILNLTITREEKVNLFARTIDVIVGEQEIERSRLLLSLMIFEVNYEKDDIVPMLRPEFLEKTGRKKEAAERLEEIIAINPANYYAWERLLLIYMELKEYQKLMSSGEKCATMYNRSFLVKLLYANGAMETGNYAIALEELRKAEILAGNNEQSVMQVITMKADVYYRMKNYEKAFEIFDDAVKRNREDLTLLNNYAYYLAEQNMNLNEAESMARQVIEKESTNPTFLDTYAWVLFKKGKLKEAARIMESIIEKGENLNPEYYEHYGFILKEQKKCNKAVEYWKTAVKQDSTKNKLLNEIKNCEEK